MNPGQNTVLFYVVVRMILRPSCLRLWWHISSNVGHELESKMNWQRGLGRDPLPASNVLFQKISIPLPRGDFSVSTPPPCPPNIPLTVLFCFIKVWHLRPSFPPLRFGISNDPPRSGYGYFLELHNIQCNLQLQLYVTACTHYSEPTGSITTEAYMYLTR